MVVQDSFCFPILRNFLAISLGFAFNTLKNTLVSSCLFVCKYKELIFNLWLSGRKYFKLLHWSLQGVDLTRKQDNEDAVPVLKSFPEPFVTLYEYVLLVYPDWDSNYARGGIVATGTSFLGMTSKAKLIFWTSSVAIIHEHIRDNGMIMPIEDAKKSNTTQW